jgi:hypothetical protein
LRKLLASWWLGFRITYSAATDFPSGFWRYVHKDDTAEHGRILKLCEFIKDELTGRDLDLFIDRGGIA